MKKLLALVLALVTIFGCTAAMAEPVTLVYSEVNPLEGTIVGSIAKFFKAKVEELSGGEIIVDEYMHTNVDGIWAVGDAIAVKHFVSGEQTIIPLASPANKQARIVADNIKGRKVKYNGTQGTSIAKVFDMTAASVGVNEKMLIAVCQSRASELLRHFAKRLSENVQKR